MSKLQAAIDSLHETDSESGTKKGEISPAARLGVTLVFIAVTATFGRSELVGTAGMSVYIAVAAVWGDISLIRCIKRMRYAFGFIAVLGLSNLFLDRDVAAYILEIPVTGGAVSMLTLFLKGFLSVCAVYFLVLYTGVGGICGAMRRLHVPKQAVTVVMLTYRYIIVLLKEVQRMNTAYHMRAPEQRGINVRAWGSFAGMLLLRSADRAQRVYDSMLLRGYDGEFLYENGNRFSSVKSALYFAVWSVIFVLLRIFPVFRLVGEIFVK